MNCHVSAQPIARLRLGSVRTVRTRVVIILVPLRPGRIVGTTLLVSSSGLPGLRCRRLSLLSRNHPKNGSHVLFGRAWPFGSDRCVGLVVHSAPFLPQRTWSGGSWISIGTSTGSWPGAGRTNFWRMRRRAAGRRPLGSRPTSTWHERPRARCTTARAELGASCLRSDCLRDSDLEVSQSSTSCPWT